MPSSLAFVRRLSVAVAIVFVVAAIGVWAAANVILVTERWEFDDVHAYLSAADRLREGQPLYVSGGDVSRLYLYSPWFAVAWIPFARIPVGALEVLWAVILIVALLMAIAPFLRTIAGIALALLLGALLYRAAGWGNVQPVLVAVLVYALPTKAGPWAVGLTASLKVWPILAVGVFARRGQWRAAGISVAVAVALWATMLLFNWQEYPAGSRVPSVYDATYLLALPGLLRPESFNPLDSLRRRLPW